MIASIVRGEALGRISISKYGPGDPIMEEGRIRRDQ